jgi:hypothetical protein
MRHQNRYSHFRIATYAIFLMICICSVRGEPPSGDKHNGGQVPPLTTQQRMQLRNTPLPADYGQMLKFLSFMETAMVCHSVLRLYCLFNWSMIMLTCFVVHFSFHHTANGYGCSKKSLRYQTPLFLYYTSCSH